MTSGWVCLHRKIKDWEWYKDEKVSRVFIHLLISANHKKSRWQGQEIQRGQLITGRKILASELGLSEKNIRTALKKLKSTNELAIKPTNRFSVITINNFDKYNTIGQQIGQQTASKRPTNGQQAATNNNDNNDKKVNNERSISCACSKYIHKFNALFNRSFRETAGRRKKLKLRLKTYTLGEILKALDNMSADKFYHGNNKRGWVSNPDFLIRSDEQVDRFLNRPEADTSRKKMKAANALTVLKWFNSAIGTNFKTTVGFEDNLAFWLNVYSEDDIKKALLAIKAGRWWAKEPSPTLLFRIRTPSGEPVDYIGDLLNRDGGDNK